MSFLEAIKNELDNEKQLTENGAVGYRTTGKALLDLNFSVTSLRNMPEEKVVSKFREAFYEDKVLAMKWLFFARDIRGGLGERRLFRICITDLVSDYPEIIKQIIPLVAEYGRYDDLWCLLDTDVSKDVIKYIVYQLNEDWENYEAGKPISLLAKWLPSANASSARTRAYAKKIISGLSGFRTLPEKEYRQILSSLRKHLNVVEVKMSAKQWNEIDYSAVPSRANLIYKNAFLRNDEIRRKEYLAALEKGETKINSSVLFPHDIIHSYSGRWSAKMTKDTALEEMWKVLPDYVQGDSRTLCVVDGSFSMTDCIGNTQITALQVAQSLGIYFSERCKGEFKDKYITFSSRPQLVDLSNANSLLEKIKICLEHGDCTNTNIRAVFELILRTAINGKMKQEDIPNNILILSDMEFDCGCSHDSYDKTLFENIAEEYAEHGYKLPRLVFWNICSRTGTIPVKQNELGVALVSGFSPVITKMVLSGNTDPYECLLEQLNAERYQLVEDRIKEYI